jgi:hypothetical protein
MTTQPSPLHALRNIAARPSPSKTEINIEPPLLLMTFFTCIVVVWVAYSSATKKASAEELFKKAG